MRRLLLAALAGALVSCGGGQGTNQHGKVGTDVHFPPSPGGGLSSVTASSPLAGLGTVGSPLTLPAATDSTAGYQSAADKTKLDGLVAPVTSFFETAVLNLTSTQTVTLVPAISGKHWRTDFIRTRVATNSGLSGAATISFGVTSPTFADITGGGIAIGGAFPADATYFIDNTAGAISYTTVNVTTLPVVFNCSVAATGGVLTESFQIWGEYF